MLEEPAFAAVVRQDAASAHCHNCFKYVAVSAIPCPRMQAIRYSALGPAHTCFVARCSFVFAFLLSECSFARYCSETCRAADFERDHKFEW